MTFEEWFKREYPLYEREGLDTSLKAALRIAWKAALEEAARMCDAYKEELLLEAKAAPVGFAVAGYRQITAEYLAAAIRSLKHS